MSPTVYELILEIRAAFRALRNFSDRMNEARGITAARRAVMEYLANHGQHTVPKIAEAKQVSRQHIQIIADELVLRGLAEWIENPGHRRSRLLRLSAQGISLFDDIRLEEATYLEQLGNMMNADSIAAGKKILQDLIYALDKLHPDGRHK